MPDHSAYPRIESVANYVLTLDEPPEPTCPAVEDFVEIFEIGTGADGTIVTDTDVTVGSELGWRVVVLHAAIGSNSPAAYIDSIDDDSANTGEWAMAQVMQTAAFFGDPDGFGDGPSSASASFCNRALDADMPSGTTLSYTLAENADFGETAMALAFRMCVDEGFGWNENGHTPWIDTNAYNHSGADVGVGFLAAAGPNLNVQLCGLGQVGYTGGGYTGFTTDGTEAIDLISSPGTKFRQWPNWPLCTMPFLASGGLWEVKWFYQWFTGDTFDFNLTDPATPAADAAAEFAIVSWGNQA